MGSLVLYVNDLITMTKFYSGLLNLQISDGDEIFTRLSSDQNELVLHQIPNEYLEPVNVPPTLREDCVWKPTFDVRAISESRDFAPALGGSITDESRQWELGGFLYSNGNDPEGNIIQIRQPLD